MNKRRWKRVLMGGMLMVFLWGKCGAGSRAEAPVPWLDGMWLNGKTMEEIEPYFGAEPICLNVHMQEEQAVKAVVLAGEEETTVPLVYEAQEDGWAAEAVLSPEEGCWRFCLLWEKEDGSEETLYESEDFILDRTAPEAEVWVTKQGAGQTEDGEKPADDGSSEDGGQSSGGGQSVPDAEAGAGEAASLSVGIRVRELHWDPSLAAICLNRLRCGEEQGQPEDPDGEAFAGAASPDGKEEPEPSADGVWQEVEEGVWEWQKNIQEEGNWQIDFQTVDLAGNLSSPVSTGETLDGSAPQLLDTAFTADGTPVSAEVQETMVCRERLEGRLLLEDLWSGVAACHVWMQKEGEERQLVKDWTAENPVARAEISFSLTEEGQWTLLALARDGEGNVWKEERELGVVQMDARAPLAGLSVSGTSGENGFYTGEGRLHLEASDTGSGLEKMQLLADGDPVATFSCEGKVRQQETVDIPEAYEGIHQWTLQVWDVAGNRSTAAEEVRLDGTAPRVELEAEALPCKTRGYYASPRKIRIRVGEAFAETPCQVDLYRQGTYWRSVSCERTDADEYEGAVLAEEEGSYDVEAVCRDLAGNTGKAGLAEPFVIDRTAPEITVTWEEPPEGGREKDGVWYCRGTRYARICVTDDFPDEKDISCVVEKDGVQTVQRLSFAGNGRTRQARLRLEEEGTCRLFLSARDLAGNQAVPYESEQFVLDNTPPTLSFDRGQTDTASGERTVAPRVQAADLHAMEQGLTVHLYRTGNAPGQIWQEDSPLYLPGTYAWEETENSFVYGAWPLQQRLDGCYRLEARAEDLAGNVQQESWDFTVNRFGSVFVFGQALLQAGQQYYVNEKPDVVIREFNPNRIVSRKILLECDAGIRVLKEGQDYVTEQMHAAGQWSSYLYRLRPEVLAWDGGYRLSVHTTDQAGNSMDTRRQKELAFFLDREAPEITVEQTKEKHLSGASTLLVSMKDLSGVQRAAFQIDGKDKVVYEREEIQKVGGRFALTVPAAGKKQTVTITALDLAGNEGVTRPFSVAENTFTEETKPLSQRKEVPKSGTETAQGSGDAGRRRTGSLLSGCLLLFLAILLIIVQICAKIQKKKNGNC